MKKFLSILLSLILLTNFTFISFAFAENDSSVKIEKTESNTKSSKKNDNSSDKELQKKIIIHIDVEKSKDNTQHKTVLDILYKILKLPLFLLKETIKVALKTLGNFTFLWAVLLYQIL